MRNPFTAAMTKILKIVVKHHKFLKNHPLVLAKIMKEYDDLHNASRHHPNENWHDWNNLKYAVIDLEENPKITPEYANLVYDAWASTISGEEDLEEKHPLENKLNKTMDEIVTMCLDPNYRYNCLFPNRRKVLDYYLCCIGTGYGWSQDGFIGPQNGPSGSDMNQFVNYQTATIPEKILQEFTWLSNPDIIQGKDLMLQSQKAHFAKKQADRERLKLVEQELLKYDSQYAKEMNQEKNSPFYPLCEYSLLCNIPKNAHPSYLSAAKEVCLEIISSEQESSSNKKIAQKVLKIL